MNYFIKTLFALSMTFSPFVAGASSTQVVAQEEYKVEVSFVHGAYDKSAKTLKFGTLEELFLFKKMIISLYHELDLARLPLAEAVTEKSSDDALNIIEIRVSNNTLSHSQCTLLHSFFSRNWNELVAKALAEKERP